MYKCRRAFCSRPLVSHLGASVHPVVNENRGPAGPSVTILRRSGCTSALRILFFFFFVRAYPRLVYPRQECGGATAIPSGVQPCVYLHSMEYRTRLTHEPASHRPPRKQYMDSLTSLSLSLTLSVSLSPPLLFHPGSARAVIQFSLYRSSRDKRN